MCAVWVTHSSISEDSGLLGSYTSTGQQLSTFGRYRRRCEDDIKIDLLRYGMWTWPDLAENRDKWWGLVNAVMNFQAPQNMGSLLTT